MNKSLKIALTKITTFIMSVVSLIILNIAYIRNTGILLACSRDEFNYEDLTNAVVGQSAGYTCPQYWILIQIVIFIIFIFLWNLFFKKVFLINKNVKQKS